MATVIRVASCYAFADLAGRSGPHSSSDFCSTSVAVFRYPISADDKGQDPENELRELRDWVINSGHIISREYVDYESGRKGAEKRKQFTALFADAAKSARPPAPRAGRAALRSSRHRQTEP